MNTRTLKTLEYHIIKEQLRDFAGSILGKKKASELQPFCDVESIKIALDETNEALHLIERFGNPNIYEINDISKEIAHVKKGGYMVPKVLLDCLSILKSAEMMKNYLYDSDENKDSLPRLTDLSRNLSSCPLIRQEIERVVRNEEELTDDASPALKRIRREIVLKTNGIKDKLATIIKDETNQKVLQDALYTVREGRYVVPIKSHNKNTFDGIIHDQSQTGQTVYIEPLAVVNLNNEIRLLEAQEEKEIIRILQKLSNQIAEVGQEMIWNQEIMAEFDLVFAKAKLSIDMDANRPILNEEKYFHLRKARHPLIPKEHVVPIDIYLGDDYNTLVITGPNTGGKTVTLKTVGLLTVMAQSGLNIPCEEKSRIAVFDDIYTDIGDEQSIEQSLSTFSAHMTNIIQILKQVTDHSLVLLDELGAGTDPTEGAALAMAILENLLIGRIRTIATTHYSQLKLYALTTEGVKNGAVEFDVNTLSPTYRLTIGLPGKSNAFEISKRLGLDYSLIERAKEYISEENKEFEDILKDIEKDQQTVEREKKRQETLRDELLSLKKQYEAEIEKTNRIRDKIIDEAEIKAKEIYQDAQENTQKLIKELKFMRSSDGKESSKRANEIERIFKRKTKSKKNPLLKINKKMDSKIIQAGDEVEILGIGQIGTVLTNPDRKGEVQIQLGIMKMMANIKNLKKTKSQEDQQSVDRIQSIIKNKKNQSIRSEFDVRGKNVEEAILEIDKYIDNCMIVGLKNISIIHGKGTGLLRKGLKKYFEKDRRIKEFRDGTFQEGGLGVTVISLK